MDNSKLNKKKLWLVVHSVQSKGHGVHDKKTSSVYTWRDASTSKILEPSEWRTTNTRGAIRVSQTESEKQEQPPPPRRHSPVPFGIHEYASTVSVTCSLCCLSNHWTTNDGRSTMWYEWKAAADSESHRCYRTTHQTCTIAKRNYKTNADVDHFKARHNTKGYVQAWTMRNFLACSQVSVHQITTT